MKNLGIEQHNNDRRCLIVVIHVAADTTVDCRRMTNVALLQATRNAAVDVRRVADCVLRYVAADVAADVRRVADRVLRDVAADAAADVRRVADIFCNAHRQQALVCVCEGVPLSVACRELWAAGVSVR